MTSSSQLGTFLVDGQGRSLYLFEADTSNVSTCTASTGCATTWPPLTVTSGQSATAGGSVQQSLLGTSQRPDGGTQVTYNGHPLYLFSGDSAAGQTNGEGIAPPDPLAFGNSWYLVQPNGTNLEPTASPSPGASASPVTSGS